MAVTGNKQRPMPIKPQIISNVVLILKQPYEIFKFSKWNQSDFCKFDCSNILKMKKVLFIGYTSANYDKVELIKKELDNHPLFEALVVEDKRNANDALGKLIKKGINSADYFIPILSSQSYRKQWINQEIGYAVAKKKPIKPIIERSLLNDDNLKGFIHNQNQLPYKYSLRMSLNRIDENKEFMSQFKLIIQDLEEELNQKIKSELSILESEKLTLQDNSDVQIIQKTGVSSMRTPLGTKAKTGEICPENGEWESIGLPKALLRVTAGFKMPFVKGRSVNWKLVKYI
jgi:TIR domain